MADPASFTDRENWTGGFYELSLEIGDHDDARLERALTALWQAAGITGPYADQRREPADQQEVPATPASLHEFGHLYGVAEPLGTAVVCGCYVSRFDDAEDWLNLYLPLGALANTDRRIGAFPFGPEGGPQSLAWRTRLDGWLATVAARVFDEVGFRVGLIGFELDYVTAAELAGEVPDQRWNGYLLPADGRLRHFPANR
ncbi:hypothetical protein ACFWNN_04170 [Lentzea sp. NPDC058450]|uniref:hypothetical protein n=1 Tax=Lentzea sp. NPDC058450 TaxID=3346505 RepID=UPI003667AB66